MLREDEVQVTVPRDRARRWESFLEENTSFRTLSDFVQYAADRTVADTDPDESIDVVDRINQTDVSSPPYAVCFVIEDGRALLIERNEGPIEGLQDGPALQCNPSESPLDCAIRGSTEILGVTPEDPTKIGEIVCTLNGEAVYQEHIFRSEEYSGQPAVSQEGWPTWASLGTLPYSKLWMDDRIWLPLVLEDRSFAAWFDYVGADNWWDAALVDFDLELDIDHS